MGYGKMIARLLGMSSTFKPSRIPIFNDLHNRPEDPVSHSNPPEYLTFLWQETSFKNAIQVIFGHRSSMLLKLVGNKLIIPVETSEFEYELPQPALLKTFRRRIVKIDNETMLTQPAIYPRGSDVGKLLEKRKELQVDYSLFLKGMLVKDLIPLDYIHKMVEEHKPFVLPNLGSSMENIRQLLKFFNEYKILKLINEYSESNNYLFTDSISMYNAYKEKGIEMPQEWKNIRDLHDMLSKQVTTIKTLERNRPFEYTDKEKQLLNYEVSNKLKLVLPTDITELVHLGTVLKNCAGSYDQYVLDKQKLIVAVYKKDDNGGESPTYLMEISNPSTGGRYTGQPPKMDGMYIAQFRAISNGQVKDEEDKFFVESIFNIWFKTDLPKGPLFKHKVLEQEQLLQQLLAKA